MGDGRGDTSAAEPRIQWQQGACCISFGEPLGCLALLLDVSRVVV
jgi:hypothetical protein